MSYEQITALLGQHLVDNEISAVVEELETMEPGEAAYLAIKLADTHPEQKIALLRALRECLPGAF